MRVLIIDCELMGLDFAQRCVEDGHEVRWFLNPSTGKEGVGFDGVKRVPDWREHMKWAKDGLIVLTGNAKYLRELEGYRRMGFPVFGPSVASAKLEIDRAAGMQAMQEVGIEIPPYKQFASLKAAETFARKSDQAWVFKTMGDEEDKSLSYVSSDPADLVGWLQRQQARGLTLKGPCMLQEKIDMVAEFGVSGWVGPAGFLADKWQLCFEHKKLMAGDKGPNCFTPDSEVLTRTGWKAWPEVTMDDDICTLKDGQIEYEKPKRVVVGDFDGELIGWQTPYLDILVTPGHNMYVQDDHYRQPFWFEPAHETLGRRRTVLRAGGVWRGDPSPIAGELEHAALLGIYLADGSTHRGEVVFGNLPDHKIAEFSQIVDLAGYGFRLRGRDLVIGAPSLAEYFRAFGKSHEKFVPSQMKDAEPSVIKAFLDAYALGDGTRRQGNLTISTSSRRMADDLQELALKVGWAANVRVRDRRGEAHQIGGYTCVTNHIGYEVGISKDRLKAEISPDCAYRDRYAGKVYCVTVSSHVIYVRRNGKACWIGQTGEMGTVCQYVEDDPIVDAALKPMELALIKAAHRGDFAVNCGIDRKGRAWPFEFTCRLGWPAFFIQVASHKGDVAQWMRDLLDGKDTLKVRRDVAIGVVLAQPRFPYGDSRPEMVEGNPIGGIEGVWSQAHPAQMMRGVGPVMGGGRVVDAPTYQTAGEIVAVMTGLGATVEDARKDVYGAVDEVKIPNMMYRNDIGCGLEGCLTKLHRLGFAK
ncbi:MAG TPA: LAGLIDADG family homing endonuclease, partial [Caulobacteraceae bacterium]|nr:LAGLIDADG family homing endonuclease [Caulobacteraceae bacterium]